MTNKEMSARLTQLTEVAEFAQREDWLYQAELKLAGEFSLIAQAFVKANPGAEAICKNYTGAESVLIYGARSSIIRSIKTIEKSLDKLQGLSATCRSHEQFPDYLAPSNPAQTFFQSEMRRRNLAASGGEGDIGLK